MKTDFRLRGLSKPRTATLELLGTDRETFWAPFSDMPTEVFDTMFKYVGGNWSQPKICEVEHDGLNEDGIPINPKAVAIRDWDLSVIPLP